MDKPSKFWVKEDYNPKITEVFPTYEVLYLLFHAWNRQMLVTLLLFAQIKAQAYIYVKATGGYIYTCKSSLVDCAQGQNGQDELSSYMWFMWLSFGVSSMRKQLLGNLGPQIWRLKQVNFTQCLQHSPHTFNLYCFLSLDPCQYGPLQRCYGVYL